MGELHERANEALQTQLIAARATLARNDALDRELRDTNRGLAKYDTLVQAHKEWGKPPPTPGDKEAALLGRRDVLEASQDTPEATRQARGVGRRDARGLQATVPISAARPCGRDARWRDRASA